MFCTYLLFQHFPRDRRDKGGKEDDQYRQKQSDELRNSEEVPVLCGGCSFAIRDVRKFIFAVLKEDGQLLQGFVSAPGGVENTGGGGLLLPSRNLALDW